MSSYRPATASWPESTSESQDNEARISVVDAGPMIAFLRPDEPGSDVVEEMLLDPQIECLAHAVNVCEVFYDLYRTDGVEVAHAGVQSLQAAGIEIREDMDQEFWYQVGRLKGDPPRKSIADCCGIALAQRVGGEFVTGDHHEMDRLVPLGLCPIRFFR